MAIQRRGDVEERSLLATDETLHPFLNGALKIIQKKEGYRFSIDAVLLSQFVKIKKNEKVLDLGTGCGILPLLLSRTAQTAFFIGVEIQQSLVECAIKNVVVNHLQDRISILQQDFRKLKMIFPPSSFDVVLSNPPYRKYRTGRVNPAPEKAIARHEIKGTLHDLVTIASYLLPNKGRFYVVYPASRTTDLLVTLREKNLEPKRIQLVHSRRDEKAKLILVESIKSVGVELTLLPPQFLYP